MRQFRQLNEISMLDLEEMDTYKLRAIQEVPQPLVVLPDLSGGEVTAPIPCPAWIESNKRRRGRKIDLVSVAIGLLVALVLLLLVTIGLLVWLRI